MGVDSWGVDYGLLDGRGRLIENPVHHRDRRTDGAMEALFAEVPAREVYERTGIQHMPINTLVQLYAAVRADQASLEIAETLLLIPDLFHFWLSGVAMSEYTNATTTQCLDPRAQAWATELLERLRLPASLLPELVRPATSLGSLRPEVAGRTRLRRAVVVAPATHDTASAVTAVPFRQRGSVYISAGTWSLVGMELDSPLISDEAFAANLTNEGGIDGTVRLLKNVNGLWLVHECRRAWADDGEALSYEGSSGLPKRLHRSSRCWIRTSRFSCSRIDARTDSPGVCASRAARAGGAWSDHQMRHRQPALKYRYDRAADVTGSVPAELTSSAEVLATHCSVRLPPTPRASRSRGAGGGNGRRNLLGQAIALGELGSLEEARAVVRASFAPRIFEPSGLTEWVAAHERFRGSSAARKPRSAR